MSQLLNNGKIICFISFCRLLVVRELAYASKSSRRNKGFTYSNVTLFLFYSCLIFVIGSNIVDRCHNRQTHIEYALFGTQWVTSGGFFVAAPTLERTKWQCKKAV